MARQTFDQWIPVEYSPDAIQRPDVLSAIEANLTPLPMNTESKVFPRSGAATVVSTAKGAAFTEDIGTNDKVTLSAVKFGLAFRIANEDIDDSLANIIQIKQAEFARSYAKVLDNACLGTTAPGNLGTVPFDSLYKALRTTNAATGYVADANYSASATGSLVSYAKLSGLLSFVETSEWWAPDSQIVIAHPSLKGVLRGVLDNQNHPIFVPGVYGQGNVSTPDTLFGLPIKWSLGARTSAVASPAPTGNPLVFVTNSDYLMFGNRSGVEAAVNTSASVLTDEALLVMRARKAFVVGIEAASAVLEILP